MNNYNGKIVIGTQIDTKQFDKDYNKISKELDVLIEKANKIATMDNPAETDLETYNKISEKIKELREEQENINQKKQEAIKQQQQVIEKQQETNTEISKEKDQIDKLSNELYNTFNEYEKMQKTISEAKIFDEKDVEYSEKLKSKIKDIAKEYEKITGSKLYVKGITDIEPQVEKTDKSFNKLIRNVKRLGLSLFGVHSAYTLVSKASSAYLSQDTELAQKLQNVWVGLGTFLAPALEAISDGLLKALGYLNVFITALTKVDYIARANAKSLKKQADAQKQLAAGIDEVTNLQESASGGKPSGLIEIPELDDKIVKKLQNLAEAIKENEDALKLLGIAFATVLGYKAISGIISNIGLLVGAKGLGSIPRSITIALVLAGVAAVSAGIKSVKEDLDDLDTFTGAFHKGAKAIGKYFYENETDTNKLLEDGNARRKEGLKTLEKTKKITGSIFGIDKNYLENITTGIIINEAILDNLKKQYEQKELNNEEQKKALENFIDQYNYNIAMMDVLRKNGIEVGEIEEITGKYADTINEIADGLGISDDQLNEMVKKSSKNEELTKGMYDNIKNINNIKLTDKNAMVIYDVDLDTKKAELKSENFFGKMGNALGSIFTSDYWKKIWKWVPDTFGNFLSGAGKWGGKGGGRGFADGGIIPTVPLQGVVYNPGPGVNIGGGNIAGEKGAEVIFPLQNSKFIDAFTDQLAGKLGDGTNTQLLLELNRNIAELADRPIILNVNGKSFAQATYQDYRNEQKRQNDNTQIIRS